MKESRYYTNEQLALLLAVKYSKGKVGATKEDVIARAEIFLKWLEEKNKKNDKNN